MPPSTGTTPLVLLGRALNLGGLAMTCLAVIRVVGLWSTDDTSTDPHGYARIFSLLLIPVLVLAAVTLVRGTRTWWGVRPRQYGVEAVAGVATAVSAPLAAFTPVLGLVGIGIGAGIVVVALVSAVHTRRRPGQVVPQSNPG